MHPPDFSLTHKLSDWPDCRLEIGCPCSARVVVVPVRTLLERGDRAFGRAISALRCSSCRGKPAPVYLVAGLTRQACMGPPPSWTVELVGTP
jgi:hypothetical protein